MPIGDGQWEAWKEEKGCEAKAAKYQSETEDEKYERRKKMLSQFERNGS